MKIQSRKTQEEFMQVVIGGIVWWYTLIKQAIYWKAKERIHLINMIQLRNHDLKREEIHHVPRFESSEDVESCNILWEELKVFGGDYARLTLRTGVF